MCVAAIAWDAHPDWLLVAIGNRDEYHERPSAPLARWDDGSGVIAGRDLRAGGTWLGVSEDGRFALVTNFRVPEGPQPDRPSRGGLVTGLLAGKAPDGIAAMNPFNLFHADRMGARFLGNHPDQRHEALPPGVHGLSNGDFADPWPKNQRLGTALADWLAMGNTAIEPLMAALRDSSPLPGPGPEPRLSPVFIDDPVYGTRCSTVVAIDRQGRGSIVERRFDARGQTAGETALAFAWPQA